MLPHTRHSFNYLLHNCTTQTWWEKGLYASVMVRRLYSFGHNNVYGQVNVLEMIHYDFASAWSCSTCIWILCIPRCYASLGQVYGYVFKKSKCSNSLVMNTDQRDFFFVLNDLSFCLNIFRTQTRLERQIDVACLPLVFPCPAESPVQGPQWSHGTGWQSH